MKERSTIAIAIALALVARLGAFLVVIAFATPCFAADAAVSLLVGPRQETYSGYSQRARLDVVNAEVGLEARLASGNSVTSAFGFARTASLGSRFSAFGTRFAYGLLVAGGDEGTPEGVPGRAEIRNAYDSALRFESGLCLLRRTLEVFGELGALEASTDYVGVDFRVSYRKTLLKGFSGVAAFSVGYASSIGSYQSAFAHAAVLLGVSAEMN